MIKREAHKVLSLLNHFIAVAVQDLNIKVSFFKFAEWHWLSCASCLISLFAEGNSSLMLLRDKDLAGRSKRQFLLPELTSIYLFELTLMSSSLLTIAAFSRNTTPPPLLSCRDLCRISAARVKTFSFSSVSCCWGLYDAASLLRVESERLLGLVELLLGLSGCMSTLSASL